MALSKRSVILDAELVDEAVQPAGPRGFSRLVNEALRQYLQPQRRQRLEADLAAEHGVISPEVWTWARQIEWPR